MFVAALLFNETALRKLARRGISETEARQLPGNGAILSRNPHPRAPRSRLMIGPTSGGRLLTVVIEPEPADEALWHVRTAWDSSVREWLAYDRGG
jgi:hypothetical protein